jgi:hypothetical protein
MKLRNVLLLGALTALVPSSLSLGGGRPPSTQPPCPLRCPAGYSVVAYSWALQPERTIYDEQGQAKVPPDGVWEVSCSLRCEQHSPNTETKTWTDKKPLCKSGGEPSPYSGPWRITGPFSRVCDARENNGCGMHCYAVRTPKPASGKKATRR